MQNNQHSDLYLLRLPEVLKIIPVSKSTWWAGVSSGKYPKPVKISNRCVAWLATDIQNLVESFYMEAA